MPAPQTRRIVITGAAGLVGQNLIVELKAQGFTRIVAIDRHADNLAILRALHPGLETHCADLAETGPASRDWQKSLVGADCLVILHARITSKHAADFAHDNIAATSALLAAAKAANVPHIVHVSSSVVVSKAHDDYSETKRAQEKLVLDSGIPACVLRPTLMFGWFDPKHLGWLSRFMERVPVFPLPGTGRYMRQPLYERDFCRCLVRCIADRRAGAVYDIVGDNRVDYVDIIRTIKRVKDLRTVILPIPVWLFATLLRIYALFSASPPFTADQLKALAAGDDFSGVDTQETFGVTQTPFEAAIRETFCDPRYSKVVLDR